MTVWSGETPELITSKDGTTVAYWQVGRGEDPLLLVHGATSDHARWAPFLPLLTSHRDVCVMDRRGRGSSGDAKLYSIEQEYEDVAAVIDAIAAEAGRPVDVFGHSFGALCSLEAALLTTAMRKLVLYEAPAHHTNTPELVDHLDRIDELVTDGRRDEAVDVFFREVVRAPDQEIELLRAKDAWSTRVRNAHTIVRELRAALGYRSSTWSSSVVCESHERRQRAKVRCSSVAVAPTPFTAEPVTVRLQVVTEISPFGIRRAAFIHATPERVWTEFTTFDRMKAWYGTGHELTRYEPRVGGIVETSIGDEPTFARGQVLVFDPGRELTFEQRWIGPDWTGRDWAAPAKVTILLTSAGGGTLVELFHHGYDLIGGDPAEYLSGFEGGWDTHHLDALGALVAA